MNYQRILIDLLEKAGYIGTDANLGESLFCYGMVYNPNIDTDHLNTIVCMHNEKEDKYIFDYTDVRKDDIKDAIEKMDENFFDYVGISKEEYLEDVKESRNLSLYFNEIQSYNGYLCTPDYHLTVKDVIKTVILEVKSLKKEHIMKLKKNMIVRIYCDPITTIKLEGEAKLIKLIRKNEDFEHWKVKFVKDQIGYKLDKDEPIVERKIKI